jgi:hypothetical protein
LPRALRLPDALQELLQLLIRPERRQRPAWRIPRVVAGRSLNRIETNRRNDNQRSRKQSCA